MFLRGFVVGCSLWTVADLLHPWHCLTACYATEHLLTDWLGKLGVDFLRTCELQVANLKMRIRCETSHFLTNQERSFLAMKLTAWKLVFCLRESQTLHVDNFKTNLSCETSSSFLSWQIDPHFVRDVLRFRKLTNWKGYCCLHVHFPPTHCLFCDSSNWLQQVAWLSRGYKPSVALEQLTSKSGLTLLFSRFISLRSLFPDCLWQLGRLSSQIPEENIDWEELGVLGA